MYRRVIILLLLSFLCSAEEQELIDNAPSQSLAPGNGGSTQTTKSADNPGDLKGKSKQVDAGKPGEEVVVESETDEGGGEGELVVSEDDERGRNNTPTVQTQTIENDDSLSSEDTLETALQKMSKANKARIKKRAEKRRAEAEAAELQRKREKEKEERLRKENQSGGDEREEDEVERDRGDSTEVKTLSPHRVLGSDLYNVKKWGASINHSFPLAFVNAMIKNKIYLPDKLQWCMATSKKRSLLEYIEKCPHRAFDAYIKDRMSSPVSGDINAVPPTVVAGLPKTTKTPGTNLACILDGEVGCLTFCQQTSETKFGGNTQLTQCVATAVDVCACRDNLRSWGATDSEDDIEYRRELDGKAMKEREKGEPEDEDADEDGMPSTEGGWSHALRRFEIFSTFGKAFGDFGKTDESKITLPSYFASNPMAASFAATMLSTIVGYMAHSTIGTAAAAVLSVAYTVAVQKTGDAGTIVSIGPSVVTGLLSQGPSAQVVSATHLVHSAVMIAMQHLLAAYTDRTNWMLIFTFAVTGLALLILISRIVAVEAAEVRIGAILAVVSTMRNFGLGMRFASKDTAAIKHLSKNALYWVAYLVGPLSHYSSWSACTNVRNAVHTFMGALGAPAGDWSVSDNGLAYTVFLALRIAHSPLTWHAILCAVDTIYLKKKFKTVNAIELWAKQFFFGWTHRVWKIGQLVMDVLQRKPLSTSFGAVHLLWTGHIIATVMFGIDDGAILLVFALVGFALTWDPRVQHTFERMSNNLSYRVPGSGLTLTPNEQTKALKHSLIGEYTSENTTLALKGRYTFLRTLGDGRAEFLTVRHCINYSDEGFLTVQGFSGEELASGHLGASCVDVQPGKTSDGDGWVFVKIPMTPAGVERFMKAASCFPSGSPKHGDTLLFFPHPINGGDSPIRAIVGVVDASMNFAGRNDFEIPCHLDAKKGDSGSLVMYVSEEDKTARVAGIIATVKKSSDGRLSFNIIPANSWMPTGTTQRLTRDVLKTEDGLSSYMDSVAYESAVACNALAEGGLSPEKVFKKLGPALQLLRSSADGEDVVNLFVKFFEAQSRKRGVRSAKELISLVKQDDGTRNASGGLSFEARVEAELSKRIDGMESGELRTRGDRKKVSTGNQKEKEHTTRITLPPQAGNVCVQSGSIPSAKNVLGGSAAPSQPPPVTHQGRNGPGVNATPQQKGPQGVVTHPPRNDFERLITSHWVAIQRAIRDGVDVRDAHIFERSPNDSHEGVPCYATFGDSGKYGECVRCKSRAFSVTSIIDTATYASRKQAIMRSRAAAKKKEAQQQAYQPRQQRVPSGLQVPSAPPLSVDANAFESHLSRSNPGGMNASQLPPQPVAVPLSSVNAGPLQPDAGGQPDAGPEQQAAN